MNDPLYNDKLVEKSLSNGSVRPDNKLVDKSGTEHKLIRGTKRMTMPSYQQSTNWSGTNLEFLAKAVEKLQKVMVRFGLMENFDEETSMYPERKSGQKRGCFSEKKNVVTESPVRQMPGAQPRVTPPTNVPESVGSKRREIPLTNVPWPVKIDPNNVIEEKTIRSGVIDTDTGDCYRTKPSRNAPREVGNTLMATNGRKRNATQMGAREGPETTSEEEELGWKNRPSGLNRIEETIKLLKKHQRPMEVEVEDKNKVETLETVELKELPGIEPSRIKAGDQVITSGAVSQNWSKVEDRSNREDKILWKAIKQVILAKPNEERYSREYYREEDYDGLLNEAAKELQIVTTEKPRVHINTRAYIAKEMRSLGFLFGFYI